MPVAGSTMWEYRPRCCSAPRRLRRRHSIARARLPPASIVQPRFPGGASLNARSPLTATSALRIPARAQHGPALHRRISFRDSAHIQPQRGVVDGEGARGGIEMQFAIAAVLESIAKGGRIRQAALLPRLAPEAGDRADGDVERAIRIGRELLGRFEDAEQVRARVAG